LPESQEEADLNCEKRFQANDPVSIREMGMQCFHKEDYDNALDYLTKAAELGDAKAHYHLSLLYGEGKGVEKDEKKEVYYLEKAAIAGHPRARHNLGCYEEENDRIERAVKHWIIAANLGLDEAIQALKGYYADGEVSKDEFATALRAHQAAVNATKSPQREAAEKFLPNFLHSSLHRRNH
jgi:TPR repeat protein